MGRRKKAACAGPSASRKWWQAIEDEDPITLEPIGELAVPPFELFGRHFDGASLAAYLVDSGRLEDPTSRQPLGRDVCVALDEHLRRWAGDASRSVERLFALSEHVRVRGATRGVAPRF